MMPDKAVTAANLKDPLWPTYMYPSAMPQNGTFGNNITLHAAYELYCVMFKVFSSYSLGYITNISPMAANPLCAFSFSWKFCKEFVKI